MERAGWLLRVRVGAVVALLIAAIAVSVAATQDSGPVDDGTQGDAIADARQMLAHAAYDDALDTLNTVLQSKPDNGEARFLKGLALAHSGQTEAALGLFDTLAQDYPDMAEAWNNLGVLRARTGDLDGARKALSRAKQLNPKHVAARQNLGDVYVALAQHAYHQASTLAPDNPVLQRKMHTLAQFLRADGQVAPHTMTARAQATHESLSDAPMATAQVDAVSSVSPQAGQDQHPTRVASAGAAEIVVSRAMAGRSQERPTPKALIRASVQDWADAWSAQDLQAYFAAYSPRFDPNGTRTIQQWRALRVRRVGGPDWITVAVSDMDVMLTGADTATVTFEQAYESNTYQDHVRKTLTLVHTADGWLIKTES